MLLYIRLRSKRLFKRAQAGRMPAQASTSKQVSEKRDFDLFLPHAMPPITILCKRQTQKVQPVLAGVGGEKLCTLVDKQSK